MSEINIENILQKYFDYESFTDDHDGVFRCAGLNLRETELSQKDLYYVVGGGNRESVHDRIREEVDRRIERMGKK